MSTELGSIEVSPIAGQPINHPSPARYLAVLASLIFLAEMFAMMVLYFIRLPNYLTETVLDGMIMLVLILPGLYFLQLNPLLKQINDRIRAEKELTRSEELLRKVLELLPIGVWITDKSGQVIHGNPASLQIWGGAHYVGIDQYDEYKGWWANTGKRIQGEEWAGAKAITRGETSLNEEIEIECFDGTQKIILNSALPILNEQNLLLGAIIVNQDITERKQAALELMRTNELLERFFFSIDTLIAYMDRDFNFIRVNETYAREGGHPVEFYIGKNHFDLYPSDEHLAIFRQVVETGEPYSVFEKPFEYTEYPKRGVTYWDWSLQPVKGSDGSVEGLVLSLVDVSGRKLAELQLERQNQALYELSNAERRQREVAESLVQATLTVNKSLDLEQVLYSILEQIRKAIPFQGAGIILLEDHEMRVAGCLGFEDYPEGILAIEGYHALNDHPLIKQIYASHQPVLIDVTNVNPEWQVIPGLEWVVSYIAAPLIVNDKVTGILNLYSELSGAFTQESAGLLVAFASPAALALHNAQLYRAESIARQTAETLGAAAQALTQTLNLDDVINTLLDHVHLIIHSDTAGVTLLEDEERLTVKFMRGYGPWGSKDSLPSIVLTDGVTDSLVQRMVTFRKSMIIPNVLTYPIQEQKAQDERIQSWLVAPIIASDNVIGLLELGKAGAGHFSTDNAHWAEALAGQAAVAIQNAMLFTQVHSSSERLQFLAHKMVEVQENERLHISRELHDEASQALSSLKLSLGRLEQDPICPERLRPRIWDLKILADGVLESLHRLAVNLRPVTLDQLGLVAALEQYAHKLNSQQLSVQFKALGFEGERISPALETSLYRIVQEALTNTLRYAQASNVGILLERSKGKVRVFVEDDGIGFEPHNILSGDHLGLVGIRERAEMLGGNLTIESAPGKGTSLIVEVPDVN
jgi:PAS domain S-box-containing protein